VSNAGLKEYNVKRRAITFASAAFFVTSLALGSDTWIVDPRRSNARLFQGSRTNPEPVNAGVVRVTGTVKLDTNDLDASAFDLSLYPADEERGHALSPEGTLPTGYGSGATDQTLLTFKSTRILRTEAGKLEVVGDLTLSRVVRTVTATATEAYAGPVYRDPIIHNETHEIKFLFPGVSAEHLSGPLTPAMQHKNAVLEIVGSGDVPASAGEDYGGAQYTPALGDKTTIVLDLKFLHTVPEASVGMLLESGETR
jgi:polyisoprenoid-binding protein YceI